MSKPHCLNTYDTCLCSYTHKNTIILIFSDPTGSLAVGWWVDGCVTHFEKLTNLVLEYLNT